MRIANATRDDALSTLDDQIDHLYGLPLAEFTAARNALAKSVRGPEATAIKRLGKPTAVASAVNQLYWFDRPGWNRLLATGAALRGAQVAALSGAAAAVQTAAAAHREAVAAAATSAARLAEARGTRVASDALTRMLEALSLQPTQPSQPGRFVDVVQPAGLEALAGLALAPATRPALEAVNASSPSGRSKTAATEREQRRAHMAAARAQAEAEVRQTAASLEGAVLAEQRAQAMVSLLHQQLDNATRVLRDAQSATTRARAASESAARALEALSLPDRDRGPERRV